MEKFLHLGSVERVQHRGSIEDFVDLLLGIEHHNNSYTGEVWKGSYTVEAQKIRLIRCWVLSTLMIPGRRDKKLVHRGTAKRFLFFGSMDDCANPLLGIDHHNDFNAVEAWKSSYTVEM